MSILEQRCISVLLRVVREVWQMGDTPRVAGQRGRGSSGLITAGGI